MSSETREIIRRETQQIVSSGGGRAGFRSPSYIQVSRESQFVSVCVSNPPQVYLRELQDNPL